jgi:hypothetical protein
VRQVGVDFARALGDEGRGEWADGVVAAGSGKYCKNISIYFAINRTNT